MVQFFKQKARFHDVCSRQDWKAALDGIMTSPASATEALNALLALLPRPELCMQAAYGLGLAVPLIAASDMEKARVIMRRLMWSLNEESGNIGWGIPEAMGSILANSPPLADEYARIFISYGYETGKDDNYIDHGPLRRGVYWGIGRLAQGNTRKALPAAAHLVVALHEDSDTDARAFAAWALEQIALGMARDGLSPDREVWENVGIALAAAAAHTAQGDPHMLEFFDGTEMIRVPEGDIYRNTQQAVQELIA